MKIISKGKVTDFKVEWQVGKGDEAETESQLVKGVKVQVEVPESGDFAKWFKQTLTLNDGVQTHEFDAEFANHRAQVEYLVASQLLQHQGSASFKSAALKYAKDGAAFPGGVYKHDFSKALGERSGIVDESALRTKMAKMLGLAEISDEMWTKMQAVAKGETEDSAE